MRRFTCAVMVLVFAGLPPLDAQESADRSTSLPVRRVVLYKAGIGYFEHVGEVAGNAEVTISFTSGQLDDALKSLTAVDLGTGRVTGIRYNSVAPVSERLRSLRLPLGETTSLNELLLALRGARMTVRSGAGVASSGRLVSLDRATRIRDKQEETYMLLVLAADGGELRSFELTPSLSIVVSEADLRRELQEYLRIIGSVRERDVRRMTVATEGTGRRSLLVSYISEVPVWKVNYRIVLDSARERKPVLQGWAIVDNTVGEDWNDVELSLVAGAPQSFIQRISQPIYTRRPVVPLPSAALFTPQTHGATLREGRAGLRGRVTDDGGNVLPGVTLELLNDRGAVASRIVTGADGTYSFSPLSEGTYRVRATLIGFESRTVLAGVTQGAETVQDIQLTVSALAESVTVAADEAAKDARRARSAVRPERGVSGGVAGGVLQRAPAAAPIEAPSEIAVEPAATAQPLGEAFEYRIKEPITVRRNESALVPIARAETDAEKVSVWSAQSGRVVRAVWLTNTSGLTLDAGTFSVVEDGAFAGEGLLETIKPSERRLLSYANDPGVTVEAKQDFEPARIFQVRAQKGVLVVQRETRERKTYTVRNDNDDRRTVILEHPTRPGWRMTASAKVDETSSGIARMRLDVEPHKTAAVTVTEVRPDETRYSTGQITDEFLRLLVQGGLPPAEVERALKPVLAKRAEIAQVEADIATREGEIETIEEDQARLRENLRALSAGKADRGLIDRYSRQMNAQEDRLEVLRREIRQLQEKRAALEAEAARLIEGFSIDAPAGAR